MTFSFRFQSLLVHRQRLRDQAHLAVVTAEQEYARAKQDAQQACDQRDRAVKQMEQAARGSANWQQHLDVAALILWRQHLDKLERDIVAAQQLVETQRTAVEEKQQELVEATREVDMLLKLEERDRAAHEIEERRREGAALDEAAITRHSRQVAELGPPTTYVESTSNESPAGRPAERTIGGENLLPAGAREFAQ